MTAMLSCSKKIDTPKELADHIFLSLKNNNPQSFMEKYITKEDYIQWMNNRNQNDTEKEEFSNIIASMEKTGLFEIDSIQQAFIKAREYPIDIYKDFWDFAEIIEYEGVEPETNSRGIAMADIYVTISYQGDKMILRLGEMYKPGRKWLITTPPKWIMIQSQQDLLE